MEFANRGTECSAADERRSVIRQSPRACERESLHKIAGLSTLPPITQHRSSLERANREHTRKKIMQVRRAIGFDLFRMNEEWFDRSNSAASLRGA